MVCFITFARKYVRAFYKWLSQVVCTWQQILRNVSLEICLNTCGLIKLSELFRLSINHGVAFMDAV